MSLTMSKNYTDESKIKSDEIKKKMWLHWISTIPNEHEKAHSLLPILRGCANVYVCVFFFNSLLLIYAASFTHLLPNAHSAFIACSLSLDVCATNNFERATTYTYAAKALLKFKN